MAIGTLAGGSAATPLVVSFNASATQAAILAVAQNVIFYTAVSNPTLVNRTITLQLTDGAGNKGAAVAQTVTVTTPPVLATSVATESYNTGGAPIPVAPAATLSTGDGKFAGASLSVTNTTGYANDRLSVGASGGLTVSGTTLSYGGAAIGTFTGGTAAAPLVVTFNASATQASILAVAQNVVFYSVILNPSTVNRTVTLQLTDGGGNKGAVVTQTVTVATPPVLATTVATVAYTPGGSPIVVAPTATLSTGDGEFANASLSVTNTSGLVNDRLTILAAGSLTVSGATLSYNGIVIGTFTGGSAATPLVVTFNASATQAAILAVAQNVVFYSVISDPSTVNRAITLQLTDGGGNKDALVTQTVKVS